MVSNRTMEWPSIVPVLTYRDVGEAVDWLCEAFGFTEEWRAGNHRARLSYGNGAVVAADATHGREAPREHDVTRSVMVRVDDACAHHQRAQQLGARILDPPTDYPYGERQYSVEDLDGHLWTFSQSIAELSPEDWGGTSKARRAADDTPT